MEIIGIFFLFFTIIFTFVTGNMARKKGRSWFGWFIVAFFISPYLAMILLACLGDTDKKRREKLLEAEEIRQKVTNNEKSVIDIKSSINKGKIYFLPLSFFLGLNDKVFLRTISKLTGISALISSARNSIDMVCFKSFTFIGNLLFILSIVYRLYDILSYKVTN